MSKVIALISLILCFVIAANAQESSSNKILSRFELVAGPSFSKNSGYLSDYGSKAGYSFGVGYYQKLSKSFSINIRSLYEQKGSSASQHIGLYEGWNNVNYPNVSYEYSSQFQYLTFYLLPTFQFGRNKNVYVSAGGYYSFERRASYKQSLINDDTGDIIEEYVSNQDDPGREVSNDAGVSFSLGYSFKIAKKSQLLLQAFSNRGLVDIQNPYAGSQRNNTFGLMLSLRIR